MSPKTKSRASKRSTNNKRSFMSTLTLKRLSPKTLGLAFIALFALIGGMLVFASRAETVPMSCPISWKPAYSTNTGEGGGGFGAGREGSRVHAGVDFGANSVGVKIGTPVYAPRSGNVTGGPAQGYGIKADLYTGTYTFRFAHLSRIVKTGPVEEGDLIAYTGDTGVGTAHLHLEIRQGKGGTPINPGPSYTACKPGGGSSAPTTSSSSQLPTTGSRPTSWTMTTCSGVVLRPGSSHACVKVLQAFIRDILGLVPNSMSGVYDAQTQKIVNFMQGNWKLNPDSIVGPATWGMFNKIVDLEESGGGGALEGYYGADIDTLIARPPQPGRPGAPGASIGQGTGGQGGAGGTATGNNTVGGDGGAGGSGTCTGGCKPGAPGTSTSGQPGTSNPGTANQGTSGASGASGTRGSAGTSGGSGQQGSRGSQGGVSIGGQSQGTSYSGSTSSSSSSSRPPTTKQYVLRSHASGRCLDSNGTSSGKDSQLWDCTGNANQKWGFASDGTIRLGANGMCLEVEGGKTANGTPAQIYSCNGGSHQRWQWKSDGTIRSAATGKCLDVQDNKLTNGTDIQIWDCFGTANQKWGSW